jgi:hypothetical protein
MDTCISLLCSREMVVLTESCRNFFSLGEESGSPKLVVQPFLGDFYAALQYKLAVGASLERRPRTTSMMTGGWNIIDSRVHDDSYFEVTFGGHQSVWELENCG